MNRGKLIQSESSSTSTAAKYKSLQMTVASINRAADEAAGTIGSLFFVSQRAIVMVSGATKGTSAPPGDTTGGGFPYVE